MRSNPVLSIDFGSSKVTCLAVQPQTTGLPRSIGLASVSCSGIHRGGIASSDEVIDALSNAIGIVSNASGVNFKSAVVGINGTHLESVVGHGVRPLVPPMRPVNRDDILHVINHSRQAAFSHDKEQLQAIPGAFKLDGKAHPKPLGVAATKVEVTTLMIGATTEQLQRIEEVLDSVGLSIEQMVATPLASGIGVLRQSEIDQGVVCVDIGYGTTGVSLFKGGTALWAESLPVGASHITQDISILLKTTGDVAEDMKLRYGKALASLADPNQSIEITQLDQNEARPLPTKVLCEIIEARVREIAALVAGVVQRATHSETTLGAGIVLTGGGSRIAGLAEHFELAISPLKARLGEPKGLAGIPSDKAGPELATCVGLARFALEAEEDELVPASGVGSWKDRIRTLKSLFSGRA